MILTTPLATADTKNRLTMRAGVYDLLFEYSNSFLILLYGVMRDFQFTIWAFCHFCFTLTASTIAIIHIIKDETYINTTMEMINIGFMIINPINATIGKKILIERHMKNFLYLLR